MKVSVDNDLCQGHARCNALAPEIFALDDLGFCALESTVVPVELEAAARTGADACPERAITIE